MLDTIVETAGQLCEADRATVFRYDGRATVRPRTTATRQSHGIPRATSHCCGPRHRCRANGARRRTVHIPDVLADPEYTFFEAQRLGGWRATLGVPLLRDGKPIGAFSLKRSEPQPFTDKQIELVTTFADQAVIAIENVRLFEEVQARTRELQESLEQQTATSEVLQVISSSTADCNRSSRPCWKTPRAFAMLSSAVCPDTQMASFTQ